MDLLDFFIQGHNWVYSFHIFVVGPYLAFLGYLLKKYNRGFSKYEEFINGGIMTLIVVGIIIVLYHSYKLYSMR